jgi:hypothetical protein
LGKMKQQESSLSFNSFTYFSAVGQESLKNALHAVVIGMVRRGPEINDYYGFAVFLAFSPVNPHFFANVCHDQPSVGALT